MRRNNLKYRLLFLLISAFISTTAQTNHVGWAKDTIVTDDYRINWDSLKPPDHPRMESGHIAGFDQCWFRNDTLNETIAYELYTDYMEPAIYHFKNNDIPTEIIAQIDIDTINNEEGLPACYTTKKKIIPAFVRQAMPLSICYFTSYKGLKLGIGKEKAITIYGKPDSIRNSHGYEIYYWSFQGDQMITTGYEKRENLSKPISFGWGYSVQLFYKKDKLFATAFFNDIP